MSGRRMSWLVAVGVAAAAGLACTKDAPEPEKSAPEPAETAPTELHTKPVEEPSVNPPEKCIEEWNLDHSTSVLQNQRRVGPHSADFQERFEAHEIDPARYVPVEVVEAYRIEDRPLLWFTPDKTRAVADSRYFSSLVVADPTRGKQDTAETIGRLLAVGKIGGRQLLRFLIAAGVIRTYWHLEAALCLEHEQEEAEGYRATVSGVHTYYTNEKNQDRFAFDFRLAADGSMTVTSK